MSTAQEKPPLVLASRSESRKAMLDAAGVPYEARPAAIDERAIERDLADAAPEDIAEALSVAKAAAIAREDAAALVLGSDSLVTVEGRRFDKPRSREEAREHLGFFSGRMMELHSAAVIVRGEGCLWAHSDCAHLLVRDLSDDFIDLYVEVEWPAISHTVGCFRIEAMGVQLFERIEGDQFTVLGMPLLPVLGALRDQGVLQA
ncbi:Maf family protein [Qipengyuania nanhaisediminis]|uniref:Maf family protein n=1 Tax=Qipengyuania nanhaisediminis TaxID=604088 RepID=UPI0038B24B92